MTFRVRSHMSDEFFCIYFLINHA